MKMTDWFPPEIRPERTGVYKVFWCVVEVFAFWDGFRWHSGADSSIVAAQMHQFAAAPPRRWRGLAENPGRTK